MYDNLRDIVKVFRNDEDLLRLLYYLPQDLVSNPFDPLDRRLPNILMMNDDEMWEIRDKRIFLTSKSDDLVNEPICRLYVYAGNRRPDLNNYISANQEVTVDIFCNNDFEKDLRSLRISDRINELLIAERVTGIGKIDYVHGFPIPAPENYVAFRHVYDFWCTKS